MASNGEYQGKFPCGQLFIWANPIRANVAEGVSGQTESGARADCQAGESAVFKLPPKRNGKVMENTRGNFHVGN